MNNVVQGNEPLFSDEDILASPDRRMHGRQIAVLRLAKVKSGKREGWAFVRNLSASGMMLEVHSDFEMNGTVTVILTENQHLEGNVCWRQDASVGIEFDQPIDIEAMLRKASERKDGQIARLPRVEMNHPVILKCGARSIQADICDISPTGVCVRADHVFEKGKRLKLMVPKMPDIEGMVRWQAHDRIGIAFAERLSIHNLMTWLSIYYQAPESEDDKIRSPVHQGLAIVAEHGNVTTPTSYHIFGHDDLGRAMRVASLDSADAAILHSRATSRYFERVSVTNGGGTELTMSTLLQLAIAEQQTNAN